jgi:hypothetical protein
MTAALHVTTDREDWEAPLPSVEKLVRSWPGATLRVTQGLGHRRILRDPEVVEEAVRFFTGKGAEAAPANGGAANGREVPELAEAGR